MAHQDIATRSAIREEPMTRRQKWDRRFLGLAQHIAGWSKDPSTQVGAVIVDAKNRIVSVGYNGFPRGVSDKPERYADRDLKQNLIVHAEVNAMIFANRDLEGCTLYTWPFGCCARCAAQVIQHGIRRVVSPVATKALQSRWGDSLRDAALAFYDANVEVVTYAQ